MPGHYQKVTGHVLAAPAHHGPNPPNLRIFLLQHNLQAQRDHYYVELNAFVIYQNTDKTLTKQILSSFDDRFYKALCNDIVGYNN
eukprot:8664168-Ditylum_brightwellii.AAC.1